MSMTPRGSGDHHRIGSPSLNHGNTPSAYARSSVRGARSPPTPTKPSGSASSGGIHGTSRLPQMPLTGVFLSHDLKGRRLPARISEGRQKFRARGEVVEGRQVATFGDL